MLLRNEEVINVNSSAQVKTWRPEIAHTQKGANPSDPELRNTLLHGAYYRFNLQGRQKLKDKLYFSSK